MPSITVKLPFAVGAGAAQQALQSVPNMPTIASTTVRGLDLTVDFDGMGTVDAATIELVNANLGIIPLFADKAGHIDRIRAESSAIQEKSFPSSALFGGDPEQGVHYYGSALPDQVNILGMVFSQLAWPVTCRLNERDGEEGTAEHTPEQIQKVFSDGATWKLQVIGTARHFIERITEATSHEEIAGLYAVWQGTASEF